MTESDEPNERDGKMLLRMVSTDLSLLKGPSFLVTGKKYRIGRSSDCSFVVNDRSVSRVHAEVVVNDKSLYIKDLGSLNGTFVDGERLTETEVQTGQSVTFGTAQFRLVGHEFAIIEDEVSDISTCSIQANEAGNDSHRVNLRLLRESERRVLELLLLGISEKEVATQLFVSSHTVHNHVKEIYRKLKVSSRPALLALFVSESNFPDKAAR